MAIPLITPNEQDYPTLGQTETIFESNMNHLLGTHFPRFETEFNNSTTEIDNTIIYINSKYTQITIDTESAKKAAIDSISAKNEAIAARDVIFGYVIPTEATYSPLTIEAKLDMAETLNLVGA